MKLQVSRFMCAAAVVLVLAQPVQASKEIDASVVFSEHCEMMLEQGAWKRACSLFLSSPPTSNTPNQFRASPDSVDCSRTTLFMVYI